MKVILFMVLLVALARSEITQENNDKKQIQIIKHVDKKLESKESGKEVHKRGIYHHNEGFGHYATQPLLAQQALWPKSYAAQYAYNLRPVANFHRHKQYLTAAAAAGPAYSILPTAQHAQSYILRPGGATVSSYSATFPKYHGRPVYAVSDVPFQHYDGQYNIQHVAPPAVVQHYEPQPVAATPAVFQAQTPQQHHYFFQQQQQPTQAAAIPQALPQYPAIAFAPDNPTLIAAKPPQQHHYFFQQPTQAAAIPQALPQFPAIAFAPDNPTLIAAKPPQQHHYFFQQQQPTPAIPTTPQTPPTPPPANVIFPFNFQSHRPQSPSNFGAFPVGVDVPNLVPVAQNPPDSGSAVASPQIPQKPRPEPEPTIQSPPTQEQAPWRPFFSASQNPIVNRPPITLQPPYGAPTAEYLPPSQSTTTRGQQAQNQQYQVQENYYDELSDNEIEHIFQQAKYTPHHAQHLQRQAGQLVVQHHY